MEQSEPQGTQVILKVTCSLKTPVSIFMSTPASANLNTAAHSFPQCNNGCMASSAKQVLFESQRLAVVSVSPINLYLRRGPQTAEISGEQMVEWMCSNESQGFAPCFNTLIMNTEKKISQRSLSQYRKHKYVEELKFLIVLQLRGLTFWVSQPTS